MPQGDAEITQQHVEDVAARLHGDRWETGSPITRWAMRGDVLTTLNAAKACGWTPPAAREDA